MARIAGVDIPRDKRVIIAMTYIYGIGPTTSARVVATANVNPAAVHKLYREWDTADDADQQQSRLNVVRQVFSSRKFPSMIAALKQAIAIYADDPAWVKVRPPLVELTPEQAKTLAAELKAIGFEMPGFGLGARSGEK